MHRRVMALTPCVLVLPWFSDPRVRVTCINSDGSNFAIDIILNTEVAPKMSTYPLYDSTFHLYRLSPLYNGQSPLLDNLNLHARRLRQILSGDGPLAINSLDSLDGRGNSGSLISCSWELLGNELHWERAHQEEPEEDEISMVGEVSTREARGVHVDLEYEKGKHCAVLLGDPAKKHSISSFTNLPLLLVRMPVGLRDILLNYITTTFDSRISPMKLHSPFLTSSLERILERDGGTAAALSESVVKGLQLQLSFPSVAPMLKTMDVSITKDDLLEFLNHGNRLWQEEQGRFGRSGVIAGPFTAALSLYTQQHIALSLDHPGVLVSKFAYGALAVSADGKVKVLSSSEAVKEFWSGLIEEAAGHALGDVDILTQKVLKEKRDKHTVARQPLEEDQLPAEPPPPYELHDPATRRRTRKARSHHR